MIEEKIKILLEKKFEEKDYEDCFIVDISQNNTKIEVFMDCDSGLSLGKCQKLSRYLEAIIDEEGWVGPKYILEVSSPGLTRPLIPRQYKKNIGRKVKVKVEGQKYKGVLQEVTDNTISVAYTEVEKVKKKKIKTDIVKVIDFDDILEIKVIISF